MITVLVRDFQLELAIGCSAEERTKAQIISVQLALELKSNQSAVSDNLSDTVDYIAVVDLIKRHSAKGSWKLLEAWGSEIAQLLFENFSIIQKINLEAFKNHICPDARVGVGLTFFR
jgi:dihydroneopterin aldolase